MVIALTVLWNVTANTKHRLTRDMSLTATSFCGCIGNGLVSMARNRVQ
jgi:hypothetical protein